MLVLSRKLSEKIIIGEGDRKIEVVIIEIVDCNRIRLGIAAPTDVEIVRSEIVGEWRKRKGKK